MKKIIMSLALVCATATFALAQTTATDFTATDCSGTSHTLFNELDNGKVVVIAWVMPCGACVAPAKAGYDAMQSFATSNPGKVQFYIVDDYGDANCTTLSNWATSSNIGTLSNMSLFDNAGNVINMNNYGTPGMPKVVVLGGTNHQVYYNKNNGLANDQTGITAAINSALSTTSVAEFQKISFAMAPNPAQQTVRISYAKPINKVTITTVSGQVVKEFEYASGATNPEININTLAAGVYMIKVTDSNQESGVQQLIKQ